MSRIFNPNERIYAASFSGETISANAHDLFGVAASSRNRLLVRRIDIGQKSTAPADLRQLTVELLRGSTTSLSTAADVTPVSLKGWSTADDANTEIQGPTTVLASTASVQRIHADAFDEAGWTYCPDENTAPVLDKSQALHMRISAPGEALNLSGTIIFEELPTPPGV